MVLAAAQETPQKILRRRVFSFLFCSFKKETPKKVVEDTIRNGRLSPSNKVFILSAQKMNGKEGNKTPKAKEAYSYNTGVPFGLIQKERKNIGGEWGNRSSQSWHGAR
ncbi:hypothetical protein ACG2F4_18765 [Halalkalibaculum sp. DA3122]|uniref:hypothetical protein n=1 Tax=unclassified Halalkalibaculum TaxID=2964617 RepID=UPI0037552CD6